MVVCKASLEVWHEIASVEPKFPARCVILEFDEHVTALLSRCRVHINHQKASLYCRIEVLLSVNKV